MKASMLCLLLALACMSPSFSTAQVPRRALLQATVTDVGTSIVPVGEPSAVTAAASTPSAASLYAPDAPDAAVGEPIPPMEATAADLAAVAAATTPTNPRRRNGIIVPVPGEGTVAAAAVMPAQTSQITIFEHANFAGRAGVAGVGDYRSLPAEFNDMLTSIRVPAGLKVTLWEHGGYTGRGLIVTGPADIADISRWNFNDITSSFKVESTSGGGGGTTPPSGNYVNDILNLVNAARAQAGLRPVSLDSRLNNAAMAHSMDQARRGQMTHDGADGSSPGTRVTRAGYTWRWVAENVARGQTSPQSVHTSWMNSPGHRANIMSPNAVHMGIAMATGAGGPYWTQKFAAPM